MPITAGAVSVAVKPKEWKNGQDAEKSVLRAEVEQLAELLGVRGDIVMGEHDPLRFAGAAAGKNHGGEVVQRARAVRVRPLCSIAPCGREPGQC